jgi:hypothetical protein
VFLGIVETSSTNEDRSWLIESSNHVQVSGAIDPNNAKWILLDHYPDGDIPSGVAVAYDSATDRYIPFLPSGAGDELNFHGFLYNTTPVQAALDAGGSTSVGVPIVVFGFVSLDGLPTNGASTNGGLGTVLETARVDVRLGAPATDMIYIGA